MSVSNILKDCRTKMSKAVDHTLHEFSTLHTGKASPTMLDGVHVTVESYGGTTSSIKDLAAISTPEPRMIVIQPWDKQVLKDIEKAILKANIGFKPSIDGGVVRIFVPELSGDRRKEMVKVSGNMAEEGRVRVRQFRREANEALKAIQKSGVISEDDLKRGEKEVQVEHDKWISELNKHLAHKEKELLAV